MIVNRREFVKDCGQKCVGILGLAFLLEACKPLKQINATAKDKVITIPHTEFGEANKKSNRSLMVRTAELHAPLLIHKSGVDNFSALLLQCTHQGAELNVNGNLITCPAHGSEFDTKGAVLQGPADQHLIQFKVTSDAQSVFIHLS